MQSGPHFSGWKICPLPLEQDLHEAQDNLCAEVELIKLAESSGKKVSIASPHRNISGNYPKSKTCIYHISVENGHQIEVSFSEFSLEKGLANGTKGSLCVFDNLAIAEKVSIGEATGEFREFRRICGDWSGRLGELTFVSAGNDLRLTLTSDDTEERSGFEIEVTTRKTTVREGSKEDVSNVKSSEEEEEKQETEYDLHLLRTTRGYLSSR